MGRLKAFIVIIFFTIFTVSTGFGEDLNINKLDNTTQLYITGISYSLNIAGFKDLIYNEYQNKGENTGAVLLNLKGLDNQYIEIESSSIGFDLPLKLISDDFEDLYLTGQICIFEFMGPFYCHSFLDQIGIIKDFPLTPNFLTGLGIRIMTITQLKEIPTEIIKREIPSHYPRALYLTGKGGSIFTRISGIISGSLSYRLEAGIFYIFENEIGFYLDGYDSFDARVPREELDFNYYDSFTVSNGKYVINNNSNVDPFEDVRINYQHNLYITVSIGLY